MTLIRRFFSGPSLTQAILAAARHHEVDPDDLAYEVIEKKHGFLKTPRGVVIEVDPDRPTRAGAPPAAPETAAPEKTLAPEKTPAPEKTDLAPAPAPRPEAPRDRLAALTEEVPAAAPVFAPAPEMPEFEAEPDASEGEESERSSYEPYDRVASPSPVADAWAAPEAPPREPEAAASTPAPDVVDSSVETEVAATVGSEELRLAVAQAVDELVFLAGLRVQVGSAVEVDDGLTIELEGPDSRRVAAHDGRALLAIQHLLPRLLFRTLGRAMHCRLDCEGFHGARVERLERLARKAAERVRNGGRSWLLDPMPPDERRLVHMALADEPDVETESVGEGYLKRVRVARV